MNQSRLAPQITNFYTKSILKQKTVHKSISKKSTLIFWLSSHSQHFCPQTLVLLLALKFSNQNRKGIHFLPSCVSPCPKDKETVIFFISLMLNICYDVVQLLCLMYWKPECSKVAENIVLSSSQVFGYSAFISSSFFKKRFYLFIFRQSGRERERERNINVWLPFTRPLLGTWPVTQACVLTGNPTNHLLVCRLALNPLSHSSHFLFIFKSPLFVLLKHTFFYISFKMKFL